MINQSLEEATERSTTVTSLTSAGSRSSTTFRNVYLKIGYQTLAKGGGAKKRFQYRVNRNSPNKFLHLRAIQGHAGESAIDPALQDNTPIPKGFTEDLYHVGNANELKSMIGNGSTPGGTSLKRGRQAVFFTTVKATEDFWHGRNSM